MCDMRYDFNVCLMCYMECVYKLSDKNLKNYNFISPYQKTKDKTVIDAKEKTRYDKIE